MEGVPEKDNLPLDTPIDHPVAFRTPSSWSDTQPETTHGHTLRQQHVGGCWSVPSTSATLGWSTSVPDRGLCKFLEGKLFSQHGPNPAEIESCLAESKVTLAMASKPIEYGPMYPNLGQSRLVRPQSANFGPNATGSGPNSVEPDADQTWHEFGGNRPKLTWHRDAHGEMRRRSGVDPGLIRGSSWGGGSGSARCRFSEPTWGRAEVRGRSTNGRRAGPLPRRWTPGPRSRGTPSEQPRAAATAPAMSAFSISRQRARCARKGSRLAPPSAKARPRSSRIRRWLSCQEASPCTRSRKAARGLSSSTSVPGNGLGSEGAGGEGKSSVADFSVDLSDSP